MTYARQVGADVLFDFGKAEILLTGVSLSEVQGGLLFG
jgi:hypothetical protein